MNAIISSEILDENELKQKVKEVPKMSGLELSSKVTTVDAYEIKPRILYKVFIRPGSKRNIIECLVERGCHVKVFL